MWNNLLGIEPTRSPRRVAKKPEKPPISPKRVTASFTTLSAI